MPLKYAYIPPEEDDASRLVEETDGACLSPDYEPNGIPEGLQNWTAEQRRAVQAMFPVIE